MHAEAILARVLAPCLITLHAKRAGALLRATAGLLRGGVTSLSAIALSLGGGIKMVNAQGWEFVGRIRGRNRLQLGQDGAWTPARDLYAQARLQVRDLGAGAYARSNPVAVRAVLSKRPKKGRHQKNIYGEKRKGRSREKNARSAREPWLLASSFRATPFECGCDCPLVCATHAH